MSIEPTTREEAIALALDWAAGRRSWTNFGPYEPYTPDVIAVMDAQEVVKWTTIAAVLPSCAEPEPIGATEPPTWPELGAEPDLLRPGGWRWGEAGPNAWPSGAGDEWIVNFDGSGFGYANPSEVEARRFVADLHALAAPSVAPPEAEPPTCPDGGTCHHECGERGCFRVYSASPLSGVYPNDEWPAEVVAEARERNVRAEVAAPSVNPAPPSAAHAFVRHPDDGRCVVCGGAPLDERHAPAAPASRGVYDQEQPT